MIAEEGRLVVDIIIQEMNGNVVKLERRMRKGEEKGGIGGSVRAEVGRIHADAQRVGSAG